MYDLLTGVVDLGRQACQQHSGVILPFKAYELSLPSVMKEGETM